MCLLQETLSIKCCFFLLFIFSNKTTKIQHWFFIYLERKNEQQHARGEKKLFFSQLMMKRFFILFFLCLFLFYFLVELSHLVTLRKTAGFLLVPVGLAGRSTVTELQSGRSSPHNVVSGRPEEEASNVCFTLKLRDAVVPPEGVEEAEHLLFTVPLLSEHAGDFLGRGGLRGVHDGVHFGSSAGDGGAAEHKSGSVATEHFFVFFMFITKKLISGFFFFFFL